MLRIFKRVPFALGRAIDCVQSVSKLLRMDFDGLKTKSNKYVVLSFTRGIAHVKKDHGIFINLPLIRGTSKLAK